MKALTDNSADRARNAASPSRLSDEQLVVRYRETGNRDLFSELVQRYERELYTYLRRYLGDPEMAEDAFQATFLQVHLKCEQFEQDRKFRPWLYTIATNQAIDAGRRNKRHRMVSLDRTGQNEQEAEVGKLVDLLVSQEVDPLDRATEQERGQWLRAALDSLSEPMRNVIHLVYYQGLKYREAADVLDVPVGTVKSRLHAAVLKLNELWNNAGIEQP